MVKTRVLAIAVLAVAIIGTDATAQCGFGGFRGFGIFAGIRARRAARVSARMSRREIRLNAVNRANFGCASAAAAGCGDYSPAQKQGPAQKNTAGDDDVPDPPAFSSRVPTDFRMVLRPSNPDKNELLARS